MNDQNDQENERADAAEETAPHVSDVLPRVPKNPQLLARLVLRDGKPFVHAAVQCGYSQAIATRGQRYLCKHSRAVSDAFMTVSDALTRDITLLKPLAIQRLHKEITDNDSNQSMRAIELAGRFKETDWFVRSSETNVGILVDIDIDNSGQDSPTADNYRVK